MEIRLAKYAEKQEILNFINENWKKNHVFVRWPELFDDYHRNGDMLNYVIAVENGKIYGVCGFIYANHEKQPDVWVALWKVIPSGIPSLGMDIINSLKEFLNYRVLSCCGIKKEVKKLYEFMGLQTGTLKHFYRLNKNCSYHIAVVFDNTQPDYAASDEAELVHIHSEKEFSEVIKYEKNMYYMVQPWKDQDYLIQKYFHNIAYQYFVYAIRTSQGTADAVIVTKIVETNDSKAMRIVDFLGNEVVLGLCGKALEELMCHYNCEYIDFYEYGLSDSVLQRLGMKELDENDNNIIPNYFEPFEQNNVEIHFFTSQTDQFRMFKADGDQERPNFVYGESR